MTGKKVVVTWGMFKGETGVVTDFNGRKNILVMLDSKGYEVELSTEHVEINEVNAIDEFINNWSEKAIKYYTGLKEQYLSIENYKERMAFLNKHTKATVQLITSHFTESQVLVEADRKKCHLIKRVEQKAGKVLDASGLYIGGNGEINGKVVGEKSTVNVETISAGGYNIQCLHYRVLVK